MKPRIGSGVLNEKLKAGVHVRPNFLQGENAVKEMFEKSEPETWM